MLDSYLVKRGSLRWLLLSVLLTSGFSTHAQAQKKHEKSAPPAAAKSGLRDFDDFVNQALKDWKVPGVAVAVVQDGKVILLKGYGYRDIEKKLPVTPNTLFSIGSISKSFTVTTLGMEMDEGKVDWDKPVHEDFEHDVASAVGEGGEAGWPSDGEKCFKSSALIPRLRGSTR